MRQLRRETLLDAAARLIASQGPRALTLRAVAAEAGYSPAAVYAYFKGKDDLALAVLARDLGALAHRLKEADPGGPVRQRLAVLMRDAVTALHRDLPGTAYASLMFGAGPGAPDSEAGRMLTGRLIQSLQALGAPLSAPGEAPASEARDHILLAAALVLGLTVLAKSGRLALLGADVDTLINAFLSLLPTPNTSASGDH